jgi:hypothetical protein
MTATTSGGVVLALGGFCPYRGCVYHATRFVRLDADGSVLAVVKREECSAGGIVALQAGGFVGIAGCPWRQTTLLLRLGPDFAPVRRHVRAPRVEVAPLRVMLRRPVVVLSTSIKTEPAVLAVAVLDRPRGTPLFLRAGSRIGESTPHGRTYRLVVAPTKSSVSVRLILEATVLRRYPKAVLDVTASSPYAPVAKLDVRLRKP